jgi:hypothetical protein
MKDRVDIADDLYLNGKLALPGSQRKDVVQIEGFFSAVCRERGKIVPHSKRSGKNIWTLTGREYLARLMSYITYGVGIVPDTPARNDRIRYIAMGTGSTPEVASIIRLVSPTAFDPGGVNALAEVAIPTYPAQVSVSNFGNSVRYIREFAENELSIAGPIILTEAGLFTDGSPGSNFTPRTRSILLADAAGQAPVAYKSFEALKKTSNFVLQVAWEVRF